MFESSGSRRARRDFGFWIADFGLTTPVFAPLPMQNPKSAIQNRLHAVAWDLGTGGKQKSAMVLGGQKFLLIERFVLRQ
jgi:hypothetical protein